MKQKLTEPIPPPELEILTPSQQLSSMLAKQKLSEDIGIQ